VSATGRAATLPVSFFARPAQKVARELLGGTVVSTLAGARTAGRIVEVEAYLGYDDPASHGYRNRRHAQNEALFGPAGTWSVYLLRHALVRQSGLRRPRSWERGASPRTPAGAGARDHARAPRCPSRPPALLRTGEALPGARNHPGPGRPPDAPLGRKGGLGGGAAQGDRDAAHRHHQGGRLAAAVRGRWLALGLTGAVTRRVRLWDGRERACGTATRNGQRIVDPLPVSPFSPPLRPFSTRPSRRSHARCPG
jgi:hypothetical protein